MATATRVKIDKLLRSENPNYKTIGYWQHCLTYTSKKWTIVRRHL